MFLWCDEHREPSSLQPHSPCLWGIFLSSSVLLHSHVYFVGLERVNSAPHTKVLCIQLWAGEDKALDCAILAQKHWGTARHPGELRICLRRRVWPACGRKQSWGAAQCQENKEPVIKQTQAEKRDHWETSEGRLFHGRSQPVAMSPVRLNAPSEEKGWRELWVKWGSEVIGLEPSPTNAGLPRSVCPWGLHSP